MQASTDGYTFKLYLEGIRVPFIQASVVFQKYISMATIDMQPNEYFKNIPDGTLVHIFYKNISEPVSAYKLLFWGTVAGMAFTGSGHSRNYTLSAYGRLSVLNNIILASVMNLDATPSNNKSVVYTASDAETQAALSTANVAGQFDLGGNISEAAPSKNGIQAVTDNTLDAENKQPAPEELKTDTKIAANPTEEISKKLVQEKTPRKAVAKSLTNPNIVKDVLDFLIYKACYTSNKYYEIAYFNRLVLRDFINEFPATWANYMSGLDADAKTTFQKSFDNILSAASGGGNTLSQLIETILGLYFCELYEIPGLAIGGALITPEYLASDVPACNLIFPSDKLSVNFSDNMANKITRVVTTSRPQTTPGDLSKLGTAAAINGALGGQNKNRTLSGLAMYPDAIKVTKDFDKDNTEAGKFPTIMVNPEQNSGSRIRFLTSPTEHIMTTLHGQVQQDITEQIFYILRNSHRRLSFQTEFNPKLIPGQKAILFDKYMPLIFKIDSIAYQIGNSGDLATSIQTSQIELLDSAIYRHPHWYDQYYKPDKIHEVYKAYFGCTSLSDSADKSGDIKSAYDYMYERYLSSETKHYLADKITDRYVDSETEVFKLLNASASQQDSEGVIIYRSQVFDNYEFEGYNLDMSPMTLVSDRQGPVLDYAKAIYKNVGDLYE